MNLKPLNPEEKMGKSIILIIQGFKPHLLGFKVVVGIGIASTAAQELCLGFVEA
jgi:hypothetical protein